MILDTIQNLLSEFTLCPNCLGRQFESLLSGTTNKDRGEALLLTLGMEIHKTFIETQTLPESIHSLLKIDFPPFNSLIQKIETLKDYQPEYQPCQICNGLIDESNLQTSINSSVTQSNSYMILDTIQNLLSEFTLCPNCLGRQYGSLLSGTTNKARGEALLLTLGMEIHKTFIETQILPDSILKLLKIKYAPFTSLAQKIETLKDVNPESQPCQICNDLFSESNLHSISNSIVAQAKRFEFTTFLVGCNTPASITEKEEILRSKYTLEFGETLKSEFNREVGKMVLQELQDKQVEFNTPEILFIVDLGTNTVKVSSNPLFIEGAYRKLVRGIPQAIWLCKNCRGKGCEKCNHTGRNYPDSVEEYITPYIQQAAKGTDVKIHCSGREDVDALMLGKGRPFVVEVSQPKIRTLDLPKLEVLINSSSNRRLDVTLKGTSSRMVLRSLKGESTKMAKRYRMKISIPEPNNDKWDETIIKNGLIGEIDQDTPNRVKHRRADLLRKRHVYDIKFSKFSDIEAEIEIYCEGGLYVKELMHGDEGRTKPSLAEIVSREVTVLYLDVLEVEHEKIE